MLHGYKQLGSRLDDNGVAALHDARLVVDDLELLPGQKNWREGDTLIGNGAVAEKEGEEEDSDNEFDAESPSSDGDPNDRFVVDFFSSDDE